jgi:3-methyl-2-oxobutanoate hydroxymethyltransferase
MGHVGLTPQAVNVLGGHRVQGRDDATADKVMADARAIAEAGAFSVVVEGVVEPIGRAVTEAIACPTIGIGASATCDGQVLVAEDMLGLFERTPRFVKRYADMAAVIDEAATKYARDVRDRAFPGDEQVYAPK